MKINKTKVMTVATLILIPTAVGLGCWATAKSIEKNEPYERDFYCKNNRTPKKNEAIVDKACNAIPYYIPCVIATLLAMGIVVKNDKLNNAIKLASVGASAATAKSFQMYKKALRDYSEEVADRIEYERVKPEGSHYVESRKNLNPGNKDKVLYFKDTFGTEWYATEADVVMAEYDMNRELQFELEESLEKFYKLLGLKPSSEMPEGSDGIGYYDESVARRFGWNTEYFMDCWEMNWIDFTHCAMELEDGSEGYIIGYPIEPVCNWPIDEWDLDEWEHQLQISRN